jgi:hypothetical protein
MSQQAFQQRDRAQSRLTDVEALDQRFEVASLTFMREFGFEHVET